MLTAEQSKRLEKFKSTAKVVAIDQDCPVVFLNGRFLRVLPNGHATPARRSVEEDVRERRER